MKSAKPLKQGCLTGFAYHLWNNIWNTNYIFYENLNKVSV
jgi:hypothetical protein